MTAFETVRTARETLAGLRDVPPDVLAHVLDADLSLSIAAALLIESRVVAPVTYDEQDEPERIARSGR